MRRHLAVAVLLRAIAGCSSFSESGPSDAGPATGPDVAADAAGAGDGATTDGAAASDGGIVEGVPPGGKLVFVSNGMAYPPPLTGTFIGLADQLCAKEAKLAGRPATYVSWLASSAGSAIARLPMTGHWYLRNGTDVGAWASFHGGAIIAPIDHDAAGMLVTGGHTVWTGTNVGGSTAGETCMNWTLSISSGVIGDISSHDTKWAAYGSQACNQNARFYCFEL